MKRLLLLGLLVGVYPPRAFAGPAESAIVAAMKLPDAPNYSWVTAVDDDARSYEITGKTDRATDYSLVTMPMVGAVRGRTARSGAAVDNQATVLFKGDERFVVETNDGWFTTDELRPAGARGGSPGGPGGGRRGRRGGFPGGDGRPVPAYSNLQKNLSRPHDEIAIIVAGYVELKVEDGIVAGTLNDTSARLLLVHPGQDEITPLAAAGAFRLWIKDGALVKYETTLEGKLSVETASGRREVVVRQKSTTTVTGAGTTTFEVPAAARKKLGG
ncbi:MAG: hypothetical protein RLZZ15_3764 [Verrucomicrobiota bacterium]|jgi:hypothetical protein